MRRGFFVTGTDTGVGKTVVSALLCARLRGHYWKPIQTGAEATTDSHFLRKWLPANRVWPEAYLLSQPLSPHAAAAAEGIEISLENVMASLPLCSEPLVVEGAGGVLVPINDHSLMIDLIQAIGLPALVASRSGLGTINHTLLTLQTLRAAGIAVAGVVMVGESNPQNRMAIEQWGKVPVIGEVLPCENFSETWMLATAQQFQMDI